MATESFISPKLKIERAKKHIQELEICLDAFLKTDFYRLYVEKDPKTGDDLLKFETIGSTPREIPLIIGDIIHNLHSGLDLMTCEIITRRGGTITKFTNFPFRETRQELMSALQTGPIKVAGADIINLIINVIKPYRGGDDALYALHDLSIKDKHRLLIPLLSITALTGFWAHDDNESTLEGCTVTIGGNGRMNLVRTNSMLHITNYGKPTFDVFFDKGHFFEGKSILPTLHQLSQLVSSIVQAIEKAYLTCS